MLKETWKPNLQFDQQKQKPEVLYKNGVLKVCKFHRKRPVLDSLFINVAGLKAWNFSKILLKVSKNFIKSLKAGTPEASRTATLLK